MDVSGSVIVTGSRDTSVLVWGLQVDQHDVLMPVPVRRHAVEDRVWSVGLSPGQQQVSHQCVNLHLYGRYF